VSDRILDLPAFKERTRNHKAHLHSNNQISMKMFWAGSSEGLPERFDHRLGFVRDAVVATYDRYG
jgi:hypothetical protein